MVSEISPLDALVASLEAEAPAIVPRDHLPRYGCPWKLNCMANRACAKQEPSCCKAGARLSTGMLTRVANWLEELSRESVLIGIFQGEALGFVVGAVCFIASIYIRRRSSDPNQ